MTAPANEVVHICSCGATYTRVAWLALPFVGTQCDEAEHLELRNCVCGSTRAVVVYRNPEIPVEAA
jgi:hypothetical protein